MDRIEIRGLRAHGRHGVLPVERERGQTFVVDVTAELDLSTAARSDALSDTVDYGALAAELAGVVADTRYDLIETLAEHLADVVLTRRGVRAAEVRVAKPEAPLVPSVNEVAVAIRREHATDVPPEARDRADEVP